MIDMIIDENKPIRRNLNSNLPENNIQIENNRIAGMRICDSDRVGRLCIYCVLLKKSTEYSRKIIQKLRNSVNHVLRNCKEKYLKTYQSRGIKNTHMYQYLL